MKKILFSLVALTVVFASCTKSEVLDQAKDDVLIQFNPYSGKAPVTKASVANIETLAADGFQVYAFMHAGTPNYQGSVYMDKDVTGTKNEDGTYTWAYSGQAYWPATNYLDFVAYGFNANATETDNTNISFVVKESVAEQTDLLVAAPKKNMTNATSNDGSVNMTFSHLLSRIGFSLVTKDNNSIKVTIEQINLVGNFYKKGSVNLTETKNTSLNIGEEGAAVAADRPYITPSAEAADRALVTYKLLGENGTFTSAANASGVAIYDNSALYTKDEGEEGVEDDEYVANEGVDETADDENEKNRYMMIIPVEEWGNVDGLTNAQLKVKYFLPGAGTFDEVTVDLVNGKTENDAGTPIKFEAGKSYNFKLKVSTDGIGFSVTVEDWDDSTNTGLEGGEEIKLN